MKKEETPERPAVMDIDEEKDTEWEYRSKPSSQSASPEPKVDESTPPLTTAKEESDTPPTTPARNGKGKESKPGPQLIGHLPRAEEAALKTFEELDENHYQYSTLGRSREALESMSCDCQFVPGEDDPETACGEGSDCINRLTQVECIEGDCRCRAYCQNQRMQRKQYANIEIVLTDKKGFGLRAGSDIRKDAFIYEYIGDVINQISFSKRMREYAEEGLKHFYFMMLQKDEFIDATKRGGIGRFANHSCNPNCYVAKWTVGEHVRMGIYAKRNILKDEELTFNYNVDRYGHDPQPCYCGEPNCVGYLGGKTQTDVAAMDDLYLDALGISEEVEMYGLKGSKKKKSKKLDEDYNPVLKPLSAQEIPKVIQAIRQTQSREVLLKLFTRIKITEDQAALRQLMRLRGYSLMCNILEDFSNDLEVCTNLLDCMMDWPLLTRNKIDDSKIEEPVKLLAQSEDEKLRSLAEKLLGHWASLEVGYRIPKRVKAEGEDDQSLTPERHPLEYDRELFSSKLSKRTRFDEELNAPERVFRSQLVPLGTSRTPALTMQNLAFSNGELLSRPRKPKPKITPMPSTTRPPVVPIVLEPDIVDGIIAACKQKLDDEKAEAERLAAEERAKTEEEKKKKASPSKEKVKVKKHLSAEEKESLKEKRLLKLVGAVVVKCMSKYSKQMDHDTFKKHAKELTHIISEKEKRSNSYQSGKLESLSDEKVAKIKKFTKEYIVKLLRRLEKSGSKPTQTTDPRARRDSDRQTSASTPQSDGAGGSHLHAEPEIDVMETLDLGLDDYQDLDEDESGDPSPATDVNGPEPAISVVDQDIDFVDPRLRGQYVSPAITSESSNGKRSRWDQKPGDAITPSSSNPESLYASL